MPVTLNTPTGGRSVEEINAARAAAVAAGQNPYAGTGATALSSSVGLQNAPTTVLTSNAAQDHFEGTIKPNTDALNAAIAAQNAKLANDKAVAEANAKVQAEQDAKNQAALAKTKLDQTTADAKTAAIAAASGTGTGIATNTPPPKNVQAYADVNGQNPNNWQIVTNQDGSVQTATKNSDGSYTPVDAKAVQIANTQAQLNQAQNIYQAEADKVTKAITDIANGAIPLNPGEQAQVEGLKQSYKQLIDQQTLANTNAQGIANIRGYQTGAAEYDPTFQVKTIGTIVTGGINKIADLNVKMASAVATLTSEIKKNNIANIKSAWDVFSTASDKRTTALQKTITDTQAAIKTAQDDYYNRVTKPINDIAVEAAKNGADSKTVAAITAAGSVTGAINAAGESLQTATGQLGDYLQYKRDAIAKGLTPMDYGSWKTQDDAAKAKIKYTEAYNTAAGKAAAEAAAGVNPDGTPAASQPAGTAAGGITQATGLSLQAFNYLTQGTASMSRMPAAQRNQIMKEANDFLNKNGLDVSTFQSQYKAYNDVLQKNIQRANQTKIMAGEVEGSADSLLSAIKEKDMGNIKAANILKLMVGEQVNDATTMKYATQLRFMANDLAGYMAAARGASSPELQDQRDAAEIIHNGLSTKSVQAFKDSVHANEEKVAGVVNGAVDSAQKQVWDLFGAGSQYTPKGPQVNPKEGVDAYVKANPAQANTIANLYEVPGATDQDVYDYIQLMNKGKVAPK